MEILQEILVFITVIAAIVFLAKKYFFKKKATDKSCGQGSCGCH